MGYIFSVIAFLILIPVMMKLPLGIKSSSKIIILVGAFLISIIGIMAVPLLGIWKVALVLLCLSIMLVLLLEKRIEESTVTVSGMTSEVYSAKPKNNQIIVQDQIGDKVEQGSYITNQDENIFDQEQEHDEPENLEAQIQVNQALEEVASSEETNTNDNWLNSVSEDFVNVEKKINVNSEVTLSESTKHEFAEELTPLDEFVFETIEVKHDK
ncbi:hypothetical protein [Litchfieldia salsa]|uniref:Uncharacterized protein n=1 Tax=Litchfieldia salsa TaxID=930152 RepID=A0A1H0NUV0_9BACI|nr:hypothetical protein [Litchfieldia salsa]SDO96306.1 hypothetical protein SAMN05216565_10124 [Litchfieldia salsa]